MIKSLEAIEKQLDRIANALEGGAPVKTAAKAKESASKSEPAEADSKK